MSTALIDRLPSMQPIELNSTRFGRMQAEVREVCRDGVLLALDAAALPLKALVTLSLEVRRVRYYVNALVVHASAAGVGLMYTDLDPDTRRTLYAALVPGARVRTRLPFWLRSAAPPSSDDDASTSPPSSTVEVK